MQGISTRSVDDLVKAMGMIVNFHAKLTRDLHRELTHIHNQKTTKSSVKTRNLKKQRILQQPVRFAI